MRKAWARSPLMLVHMCLSRVPALKVTLRCLPPAFLSAPGSFILASIAEISRGRETLELVHFQLLTYWARNGRSSARKHSREENRRCLGYGNSKETSDRLGFCFAGISFLQGKFPGRAALLSPNLICITPQCCRLSRFSLQATSVIPVL